MDICVTDLDAIAMTIQTGIKIMIRNQSIPIMMADID
jgi:hypothetical protein